MEPLIDYVFDDHVWLNKVYHQTPDEVVAERLADCMSLIAKPAWRYMVEGKRQGRADKVRGQRTAYHAEWHAKGGWKKDREYRAKRARIVASDGGKFTDDDWRLSLEAFGARCAYCGSDMDIQRDHFHPIQGVFFGGGMHAMGNIVPACKQCNVRKRNKPPQQWVAEEFGIEHLARIEKILAGLARSKQG